MQGRVLIVAGSDSGGGAGIQADIKTVTALGGYAATAVTALTAQNTLGVFGVMAVEPAFVVEQMQLVLADIGADVIKIGMLHDSAVIRAVAGVCRSRATGIPIVLDPVMVAKGGQRLLEQDAERALIEELLPMAALITPNLSEVQALTGFAIADPEDFSVAADRLLALGPSAVLIKGGHLPGDTVVDLLRTADGLELRLEGQRLHSRNTHGTGCTLASAIATGLAEGLRLTDAVERGRAYVLEAIRTAPGFGQGHGPLNHAHPIERIPSEPSPYTVH